MGYDTTFSGEFRLNKPLTKEHAAYLHAFAEQRHCSYDDKKLEGYNDPLREAVGLPVGPFGIFFASKIHLWGDEASLVVDPNMPPPGVPNVMCKWAPNHDNTAIVWDEREKFYDYVEWIVWLITKLLAPWGYVLSGTVKWQGDDAQDFGAIVITRNKVAVRNGQRSLGRARKVR